MIDDATPSLALCEFDETHGAAEVSRRACETLEREGFLVDRHVVPSNKTNRLRYLISRAIRFSRTAVSLLLTGGYSSVYVQGYGGYGNLWLLPVALASRFRRTPLVIHHHSFSIASRKATSVALLVRMAGTNSSYHMMLCHAMTERFHNRYPSARTMQLANDFAIERRSDSPSRRKDIAAPLTIGFLSNLTIDKGVGRVIEIAKLLNQQGLPTRVSLAGPIASDALALAKGVNEMDVSLHGPLRSLSEIQEFHNSLDVFVFASDYRHEAAPLSLLEAIKSGVPCVSSKVGCLPEIAQRRPTHLVAGPSIESYTHAINMLLASVDEGAARSDTVATEHARSIQDALDAAETLTKALCLKP